MGSIAVQIYPLNLWTGRILRDDKKGYIPEHLPDILTRLNIDPRLWVYLTKDFESSFKSLVGSIFKIRQASLRTNGKELTTRREALR